MSCALIVIDMQCGSFTKEAARFDPDGVVKRINDIAERVRIASGTVIHVQQTGPKGTPFAAGSPDWKILSEIDREEDDLNLQKTACDSFLATSLEDELLRRGIRDLIMVGCATDFCVDTSVRTALAKSYRVRVASDAHTTSPRLSLTAEQVIAHHNAIWANFIAPGGAANVIPSAELKID
jgi:nicotinamidase-related amidase